MVNVNHLKYFGTSTNFLFSSRIVPEEEFWVWFDRRRYYSKRLISMEATHFFLTFNNHFFRLQCTSVYSGCRRRSAYSRTTTIWMEGDTICKALSKRRSLFSRLVSMQFSKMNLLNRMSNFIEFIVHFSRWICIFISSLFFFPFPKWLD